MHLVLPFFQQFQLPAIPLAHGRSMYFPFKQHCRSLFALLLDGFLLQAYKDYEENDLISSVFKLGELSELKTPFQLNCKLHDTLQAFTCEI